MLKKISVNSSLYPNKRNCYTDIKEFIDRSNGRSGRIVSIYGLRRSGKTTLMMQLADEYHCNHIFQVLQGQTMNDIEEQIEIELSNGERIIFIDEITNAEDFIEYAAILADKYAKEGIDIVIAGTDSLGLLIAENDELFDRTFRVETTYIPYAEHCKVLGINELDDYIQHGGLMRKGISDKEGITDSITAKRYLDSAVAENIANSLSKSPMSPEYSEIRKYPIEDLRQIINKIVEIYSGAFNSEILNLPIRKTSVEYPIKRYAPSAYNKDFRLKKAALNKEYADLINISCSLSISATDKLVESLEQVLYRLNLLSLNTVAEYSKINNEWVSNTSYLEYYIIQPAIKYNLLDKGKDVLLNSDQLSLFSAEERIKFANKLQEKIFGDMTESIIVYDVSQVLDIQKYKVLKPKFTKDNVSIGEYDMLIYDKEKNKYWGFEIKHTSNYFLAYDENGKYIGQDKNLINDELREIIDIQFGRCEKVCVLYNGLPFEAPTGTVYLNISDFLKMLSEYKNMDTALKKLTDGIPVYGNEIIKIEKIQKQNKFYKEKL